MSKLSRIKTEYLNLAPKIDVDINALSARLKRELKLMGDLQNEPNLIADMNDLDRMQLQDAMNKQQQAMQILSNILKNAHDTLKAIIQNTRG